MKKENKSVKDGVNVIDESGDNERKHELDYFLADWRFPFNAIVDPVLILDEHLRVVKANKAAIELLSVDGTDIRGKYCYKLFADTHEPCKFCPIPVVKKERQSINQEVKHSYLGRVYSVTCTPILNQLEIIGYIYSIKDISHQRQLEKQLVQAHKMDAIATLAGGIAHDFNNILGAILGNADLLLYRLPQEGTTANLDASPGQITIGEIVEHVDSIKRAGNRAKELVTQILAFSRQSAVKRKNFDITPLIKESCKLLRSSLPSTIELKVSVASNIGPIMADPGQVQQVLMNLGNNAAQSLENNVGTIEISLREIEAGRAEQNRYPNLEPGRYVVLTVKDNGKGISENDLQRIFDPFFTTRSVGDGTGMGLAVLHGIILAHDGIIDVKSTLGKGTAFTVFFPRSIQESALEEQVTANMPSGSETILFVDDEQEIVTMRTRMLEYLGYTVLSATKPETALEYFAEGKNKIDLLITDHTMPRMTGLQLAKAALEYDKELPIILCSGYSDPITPEEAQDAGIRRFLAKPLDMRLLAIAIREILPSKPKEEV
ncbi:hybrid sensor histidine kinase/response regulator [Desulfogranum marinum]|uniref:hybrid sensor histidine kinase/response regulator n=1 Tax=Desulfogranum marinum TaxID=453220 RepID=UPI0019642959|nr:ATP-binding protein [Desulfogranum marinum]MBM9513428.1 response regulator [Desulfogranum marinum]